MEEKETLFLQALKAALENRKVDWKEGAVPFQVWMELFGMAERQHILPLLYEAVYDCPAARGADPTVMALYKQRSIQTVMLQTRKTSEFLALYQRFLEAGVAPVVVKGVICRKLYPNPDYRISGDEDILIPAGKFSLCDTLMRDFGMEYADLDQDIEQAHEIPYGKKGSPLYIEAHKSLFPPDSKAYGELNAFFADVEKRTIEEDVDGVQIRTMGYTDHLFYLLCHAYKHFLHSGFGIRQVCDVVMMANAHGAEIDWHRILEQCRQIHADRFAAAVFQIGETWLVFDPAAACFPEEWRQIPTDAQPLLKDILSGGVYGAVDAGRQHSSTVTLNAVVAEKQGKKGKANIWRSIFPRASDLQGRYPWLRTKPFLLPVAWMCRIKNYISELRSGKGDSLRSVQIGEQRVELLRTYGILESGDTKNP